MNKAPDGVLFELWLTEGRLLPRIFSHLPAYFPFAANFPHIGTAFVLHTSQPSFAQVRHCSLSSYVTYNLYAVLYVHISPRYRSLPTRLRFAQLAVSSLALSRPN